MLGVRTILKKIGRRKDIDLLKKQNQFLLYEVRKLNETLRSILSENPEIRWGDQTQTRSSFNYQWDDFAFGAFLPSDTKFMSELTGHIAEITDLPKDWFKGKRVVDIGCGVGRYSFGLLKLGSEVTSVDQSQWAIEKTRQLCSEYGDNHSAIQKNILEWNEAGEFDLAFSFGVVHHTGRTYTAIRNVASKVRPGGRIFLMVYGFPNENEPVEFEELNSYEQLRQELRDQPFETKKKILLERFGKEHAHGWFDAVSPKINDLLTFEEISEFLQTLGFENVKMTKVCRNHHIVADRAPNKVSQ